MQKVFFRFSEKKIFFFLSTFFVLLCLSHPVFADATKDLTKESFMITVNDFDVVQNNASTSVDNSNSGGFSSFYQILRQLSNFLLTLIPILAGVSLVIAGYFFIFSGGEGDRVTKGKNIIKFNLIAIIVAFMSWGIIYTISQFFQEVAS